MKVLLILHSNETPGIGLVVNVKCRSIKDKVISLLEDNKEREAFDLLKKKAEPEEYLLPGERFKRSMITLIEDELC